MPVMRATFGLAWIWSVLWAPDGGGAYSGTGYVLMGMVLAAVTNATSWYDLKQEAVFEPLPAQERAWVAGQQRWHAMGCGRSPLPSEA